jgi:hypothetical protein
LKWHQLWLAGRAGRAFVLAFRSSIRLCRRSFVNTPGWTPEDKWAQAFLKSGYKELVLISQQLKCP